MVIRSSLFCQICLFFAAIIIFSACKNPASNHPEHAMVIQFEWSEDGLSLVVPDNTASISRGDAITLTAPESFAVYEWYINGKQDEAKTGSEFVFDSSVYPGDVYEIGLKAGIEDGDSIIFVNGDAVTIHIININQEE